ncbi:glycosyltransferase family 4 protein, partial [Muriicola sp.]|uniref:glycosyltransferase family 4 protein n=1 Tax=Muriicola sp. TaxID=2020856 RepID=UPI003C76B48C
GNGKHAPNTDAITYLKHEIWPMINKEVHQASLHIYGAYMPPKIKAMNNAKEGFFVHGWAENVEDIMQQARVNLVPLRYGAGLKGKLFMAVSHGTPSVTSAIGAEGTHLQHIAPLVGTDTNDFAIKAIAVYQDGLLWNNCQLQGTEMLHKHFNKVEHETILLHTLQELQANLREHREQNFIGSMLLHHSTSSSKYLSKWISLKQEKNKRKADPDPIS